EKTPASPEPPEEEPKIAGPAPPPPGVPHRPILSYDAQIGITGRIVEAQAKDGLKSHKVPIGLVNVPMAGIVATKLGEAEVLRWFDGSMHAGGPTGGGWAWDWWSPGVPENVRAVRTIDLDTVIGAHGAGLLALDVPGQATPTQQALVNVTDLAISARVSKYGALVWVTRLSTGAPVPNASLKVLRVHPKKNQQVEAYSTTTDASGLASIPSDKWTPTLTSYGPAANEAIFVAKLGDDWTFQPVIRSFSSSVSWSDVDLQQKGNYKALIFTERGVYRPGETIRLAGVVRKGDAAGLVPPAGKDVRLRVTDGEGNELVSTRGKVDAFGTFAVDIPISKTAKYGSGSITASIGEEQYVASAGFLLAAYKASAFKLAVDPAKKSWVRGDQASFTIAGEYLYGAPMNGASVRTTVTRSPIDFRPPNTDGFVLIEEDAQHGWVAGLVDQPEGGLDEKGRFVANVNLEMKGQWGPERVTLEAEVQDATHQTVAKSASAIVHPADFYLGLLRGGAKFSSIKGGALSIEPQVAAFDPSGARKAGVAVTIELVERKYAVATAEQGDGSTQTTSKPQDVVVGTCNVTTTATTATCSLVAKEVGQYRVRAIAKDARGHEVRSSTALYVVSDAPDAQAAWPKTDLRVLKLEPEKTTFKVGEKARILVTSPFKKATALVTVERAGVLHQEVIPLEGSTPVIEVAVKKEWFPNVFVSIDVVRGRIQAPPAAQKGKIDLGGPEFRFGTTELKIDPESHRLKLAIAPSKTQLAPGETFDADVAVTDQDGKPAKASVTFYAVDEGVLMLTGYKTPDPLPPFAERQRLAVFGLDSREYLARILPMKAGEKVPILGWDWPQPDGWNKGGQYGDGGGASNTPRADFRATAFFEAGRVTSEDGHAKFHIKLPDNLTSYRLMAVAASGDDRFGFGESQVQASKKLMIRPALPRLVRVGDSFEASFVVTAKDMSAGVDVTLKAAGLVVEGPSTAHVNVAANTQVPVRFKVKATQPGNASLDVTATGGGTSDRVQLTRTVELPLAMKSVAAYGETSGAMAVQLGKLDGIRPDQGGLKVKMASSALVGLDSSFDRLIEYPYGCTEQLVSRILPLVSLRDLAKEANVRLPAKIDEVIDASIAKVLEHQGYDGGFGFWDDDASQLWLSAYSTFVIEEAAKKGYTVPKESRERAVAFLRNRLPSTIPKDEPEEEKDAGAAEDDALGPIGDGLTETDKKGLQLASAAFMVDALATAGASDPGSINRLYDKRKDMPLFAQAMLLHAMAAAKLPQSQLDTLAKEIEARLRIGPNEVLAQPEGPVYAPMLDSGTRTTALVLRAFMAANPKHPLGSRLARGILNARVDGAWRSTQENLWALLALDAYKRTQEQGTAQFEGTAFLGSETIGHAFFQGMREEPIFVPANKLGGDLTFKVEGAGKMFWSAELRYATTVLPKTPLDRGFFVEKRVRAIAPEDLEIALKTPGKGGNTAKVGQLVLVDLYVESSEPRDQVVIDDPLPAGIEPIDVKLETTAKTQDIADAPYVAHGLKKKQDAWLTPAVHREHRDDRVLTFLGHVDPGLYHFRYLARATAVGTFVVPPTHVEAMYAPEVSGRTAAGSFVITRE
ncbi:MAG: alpha-2-macroglobulin family protein, partial [Polyangiales bacterium]